RLGARLTGWDIDILTPAEYNKGLDDMEKVLSAIEGMDNEKIEKMMAMGIISLMDMEEVGTGPLISELGLAQETAEKVIAVASEASKRIQAENAAAAATKLAEERSAKAAAPLEGETPAIAEGATPVEGATETVIEEPAADAAAKELSASE